MFAPIRPKPTIAIFMLGFCSISSSAAASSVGSLLGPGRRGESGPAQGAVRGVHHRFGGDAELAEERLVVGTRPEVLDGDTLADIAGEPVPWLRDSCLDRDPGSDGGRQHGRAVGLVLLDEPVDAGHRDHAGRYALVLEHAAGVDGDLQFGSGGHEDDLRLAGGGFGEYVSAAGDAFVGGALEYGQVLAGQGEALGAFGAFECGAPGVGGFVGVAGAQEGEAGDGAQGGVVLDGLVGGAVFAEADGVVGPDVDDRGLHECGEADGWAHVVGEGEEGAAVGAGGAVQGDAVEDGAHCVFADAEVQGAAVPVGVPHRGGGGGRAERVGSFHPGGVALGGVGRAAPQLGQHIGQGLEHLAGGLAGGDALGVGLPDRQRLLPADREAAAQHPVQQLLALGLAGGPVVVALRPGLVGRTAAVDDLAGVGEDVVLDLEVLVRVEPEDLLDLGHLLVAEGGAVGFAGVHLGGGGVADDRAQFDEGGPVGHGAGVVEGVEDAGDVFAAVDDLYVPAVGLVALGGVFGQGDGGVVFDGDLVLVVDDGEVAQLLGAGEGGGFGGDAFFDVAVGGDDVEVVVEGALPEGRFGVEQSAFAAGGHGHAHGGGQALAQGAGGDLDAAGVAVFGVAGGEGAPGAQGLQVGEFEAVAGEVELDVEGEAGVAGGEHEAVAADPVGVGGVVAHDSL